MVKNYELKLGTVWSDCVLICKDGQFLVADDNIDKELYQSIRKEFEISYSIPFLKNHADSGGNIWYDIEADKCFCSAQYKDTKDYTPYLPSKDHNFLAPEERFLNSRFGLPLAKRSISGSDTLSNQPVVIMSEGIYTLPTKEHQSKYRGKDILVIAAGPSTNKTNWENLQFDYIFSCNQFYKNPSFKTNKVDTIYLAPDMKLLEDEELHEYIQKYESNIYLEADRTAYDDINKLPIGTGNKNMQKFVEMYPEHAGIFNLRHQPALGMGTRMLIHAILLGAKNIYFVGIDGNTIKGPMHSFVKNKKAPPWCHKDDSRQIQNRQFIIMWEYILDLKNKFPELDYNIYNLGEGCEHNISTPISEKVCPLTDDIKKKLHQ